MLKIFLLFLILPLFIFAEVKTKPWFTGPILSRNPTPAKVGEIRAEPFLFYFIRYGQYNENWARKSIAHTYSLNPQLKFWTGLAKNLDIGFQVQGFYNRHKGKTFVGVGDSTIQFRYLLVEESKNIPAIGIVLDETLPTGSYHHLNPAFESSDGVGAGAYITAIRATLEKSVLLNNKWLRTRFECRYLLATSPNIKGTSVYGTGFGAKGTAHPGDVFIVVSGTEYQLTQNWVLACDLYYQHTNRSTFSGYPGTTVDGLLARAGKPSSEQLSAVPAIEYNFNAKMGLIAGVWFTYAGRNTSAYAAPVVAVNMLF